MSKNSAVIVGASSGVGRALACELAKRGFNLVLAARDERDLDALRKDLTVRFATQNFVELIDLGIGDFEKLADAFFARCLSHLPQVNHVFVTAGYVDERDADVVPDKLVDTIVRINFLNVVKVLSRFVTKFRNDNDGKIVVFSSIAAPTPRRRNMVYASAKTALESVVRSWQHAYADTGTRLQIYRLGYVDTAMSFGMKLLFPVASAESVAKKVVNGLDSDFRLRYCPGFWTFILFALQRLPWFMFKRLKF